MIVVNERVVVRPAYRTARTKDFVYALGLVAALVGAQAAYWSWGLYLGVWSYLLLVVLVLVVSSIGDDPKTGDWISAVSILPIARLGSLVLSPLLSTSPWDFAEPDLILLLAGAPFLLTHRSRAWQWTGVPFSIRDVGLLVGTAMAGLAWARLLPVPSIPPGWIAGVVLFFLGVVEEVVFRGIIQDRVAKAMGNWSTIVFVSSLYIVCLFLSVDRAHLLVYGLAFAVNLAFGWARSRGSSLAVLGPCHGILNLLVVLAH